MEDRHYSIYDLHPQPYEAPRKRKRGKIVASALAILLIASGAFGIGFQMSGENGGISGSLFYEASTSIEDTIKPVGYDGTEKKPQLR